MAVRLSFLMVGVWWIVFSVPLLLFVKEPEGQRMKLSTAMKEGFGDLKNTLKSLRKLKNTAFFLVAYWCYIDGVDTIIRMATDYGTALGFSASSLIVALLITQFVAFPAALIYNMAYMIIACLGFFMTKESQFYALAVCIGLFQGGIQALSRSYFSRLIPEEESAQFYGFFNLLGKFAAIIGPLLLGIVTLITGQQKYGILSLIILFLAGFILLRKVDDSHIKDDIEKFREAKR